MSDLLFHKAAMSQGHIEVLMEIWTLSVMETDGGPPFDSYRQMYEAIDEIKVCSTPWECFKTEIDNNLPDDAPNWCRESYHIWYHNPDTVITNMLDNPNFADAFNTCPYIAMGSDGKQHWNDVMSGNYAWCHAVCSHSIDLASIYTD